jgi:hypothetical protein
MDKKLNFYFGYQAENPPYISEREIVRVLEQRRKRLLTILLSLAGLLWTIALYAVSFVVGWENQTLGISLLCALSGGYICAGCFAGIVIKFRKVGF